MRDQPRRGPNLRDTLKAAIVAAGALTSTEATADTVRDRPGAISAPSRSAERPLSVPEILDLDRERKEAHGNDEKTVALLEKLKRRGVKELIKRVMVYNNEIAASQPRVNDWLLSNYFTEGLHAHDPLFLFATKLLNHAPDTRGHVARFKASGNPQIEASLDFFFQHRIDVRVLLRDFGDIAKYPWASTAFEKALAQRTGEVVDAMKPDVSQHFRNRVRSVFLGQPSNIVKHYQQLSFMFSTDELLTGLDYSSGPSIHALLNTRDTRGKNILSGDLKNRIIERSKLSPDKNLLELGVTLPDYVTIGSRPTSWGLYPSFMRKEFAYLSMPNAIKWDKFKPLSRPLENARTFWDTIEKKSTSAERSLPKDGIASLQRLAAEQGTDPIALTQGVWTVYRYLGERQLPADDRNIQQAVQDILTERKRRFSLDHLAPERRVVVVADDEKMGNGSPRFANQHLMDKLKERLKRQAELLRVDTRNPISEVKQRTLASLASTDPRPTTWIFDTHGSYVTDRSPYSGFTLSGTVTDASLRIITPQEIADHLIKRYSDPQVREAVQAKPDILILGACYGADLRDAIYRTLREKNMPLPEIATTAERNLVGWSTYWNPFYSDFWELVITSPSVGDMLEKYSNPDLSSKPTYTIQDPKPARDGKPRSMQLGGIEPSHIPIPTSNVA